MFSESRKMHLLEDVIKLRDESVLLEIEALLARPLPKGKPNVDAHEFIGLFNIGDVELMEKVINEGCEQIDPADWK